MNPDSMYRALVEQMPAVIFIAYLDQRTSQAYVSPQIERALGFSQEEWLGDPIRWYQHIHPEDKDRWSIEAAELLQGKALKSVYRVFARDGRVVWFHCEAKIVKYEDGRPWFFLGVGFDVTELKDTEAALRDRTESLRSLSGKLVQTQDQERRRIARELHDGLGQYLMALKINFDRLMAQSDGGSGIWAESKEILEQCISETRTISYLLHPPMLDDVGLASAAEWYVEGFAKRSGIEASLTISPEFGRPPKAVELAIFRVLQESLTNVHRHSGSKAVAITLAKDRSEATIEVRDHGRGIPPQVLKKFRETGAYAGVGLPGMRQRVNELGGRFEITSDEHGTVVKVAIPLVEGRANL
jgi:PAS domain S-box-containing protein